MCLFLRPHHVFPILSNFSLSYLCSCWLGYLSHHPRLFFFLTQRERKLNGSSLIVALVSLFSFLKATKCIAFHFYRMFLPFLSLVNRNSYMSLLVYVQPELDSETGAYRLTILQIPGHIKSKDSTRYSKRSAWGYFWLPQSLFCLGRFCPGVFVFIYIIYINESKLLKAVF